MIKSEETYTITDLSRELGIADHTLRYYEKEFNLNIPKDSRGRRYYIGDNISIMHEIKSLRDEGHSIKDIRKIFEEKKRIKNNLPALHDNPSRQLEKKEQEIDLNKLVDDFKNHLTVNITNELTSTKEHILKEIFKTKLELGACMENSSRKIEMRLEKHFQEVDKAIGIWRKKNQRGIWKKILGR